MDLSGRFLTAFYLRRGLRIWPIYYMVIAILISAGSANRLVALLSHLHPASAVVLGQRNARMALDAAYLDAGARGAVLSDLAGAGAAGRRRMSGTGRGTGGRGDPGTRGRRQLVAAGRPVRRLRAGRIARGDSGRPDCRNGAQASDGVRSWVRHCWRRCWWRSWPRPAVSSTSEDPSRWECAQPWLLSVRLPSWPS